MLRVGNREEVLRDVSAGDPLYHRLSESCTAFDRLPLSAAPLPVQLRREKFPNCLSCVSRFLGLFARVRRFDHKGWYDRKNLSFFEVMDSVVVAAMGPPGGGRTEISNRVLRHFNLLTYTAMEDASVATIFTTLMSHFFSNFTDDLQVEKECSSS